MKVFFYVEADGGVYTVKKDNKITLPQSVAQISFDIRLQRRVELEHGVVNYCIPEEFTFRPGWPLKTDLVAKEDVDTIVKEAIKQTYPHLFTGAVVEHKGTILLVCPARGFSKGIWTLPGGYTLYGEDPAVGVVRETKEEAGIEVVVNKILPVFSKCCGKSGRYALGIPYVCSWEKGDLKIDETEIEAAGFFGCETVSNIGNSFTKFTIEHFTNEKNY